MANHPPASGDGDDSKDFYFSRTQPFDVVFIRKGKTPLDAATADYKRVSVSADSVAQAEATPQAVAAKKDKEGEWEIYRTTPPGYTTEGEVDARRREHDKLHGFTDRSKFGM